MEPCHFQAKKEIYGTDGFSLKLCLAKKPWPDGRMYLCNDSNCPLQEFFNDIKKLLKTKIVNEAQNCH